MGSLWGGGTHRDRERERKEKRGIWEVEGGVPSDNCLLSLQNPCDPVAKRMRTLLVCRAMTWNQIINAQNNSFKAAVRGPHIL